MLDLGLPHESLFDLEILRGPLPPRSRGARGGRPGTRALRLTPHEAVEIRKWLAAMPLEDHELQETRRGAIDMLDQALHAAATLNHPLADPSQDMSCQLPS